MRHHSGKVELFNLEYDRDSPDLLKDDKCLTTHLHGFESNDVEDLAKLGHEDVERFPQVFFLDLLVHVLDVYCVVWPKIHGLGCQ